MIWFFHFNIHSYHIQHGILLAGNSGTGDPTYLINAKCRKLPLRLIDKIVVLVLENKVLKNKWSIWQVFQCKITDGLLTAIWICSSINQKAALNSEVENEPYSLGLHLYLSDSIHADSVNSGTCSAILSSFLFLEKEDRDDKRNI